MLPLLMVGAALFGGSAIKARRATKVADAATVRRMAAQDRLDKAVIRGQRAFDRLERLRAKARAQLADEVAVTLSRVAGVDNNGFSELGDALARPDRLVAVLGASSNALPSVIMGAIRGAGAGVALSTTAQGIVASVGMASTGASIGGLSGAAATNATLAWFGGGSLASGGLGMAGGTAVLSAVVAAPTLLLASFAFAKSAQEKLTAATAYAEQVLVAVEEGKSAEQRIATVKRRVGEVHRAIDDTMRRVRFVAAALDAALDALPAERRAFGALPPAEQDRTLMLGVLAGLLSELVEVAIVDEGAELIDDSADVVKRANALDLKEAA